ncbi:FAD-binding protein, partial [Halobacterium sp. CBA1126]|nr:FAD-binding protein [Halobacterium sp. CBA1126]
MAIDSEVLVVGGGLAGLTSALAAARAGADTRLVSYKQSTLRHASGLVDVLGYAPDGEG